MPLAMSSTLPHRQRRETTGDLDVLDAATQLGARLADRLPGLERNGAGNVLEVVFEQVPQLEQVCGALDHRRRAPVVERAISRPDRLVDIGGARHGHPSQDPAVAGLRTSSDSAAFGVTHRPFTELAMPGITMPRVPPRTAPPIRRDQPAWATASSPGAAAAFPRQGRNVTRGVTERLQPIRHAEAVHEPGETIGEHFSRIGLLHPRHIGAECSGASICRAGFAAAVNRKTAGALRMTDIPCGTNAWSSGYPGA